MGWGGHTITFNSVDAHIDGAWLVKDPTPLRQDGAARGPDLTIPDSDGVKFRGKKRGLLRVLLELYLFGDVDHTGAAHPSVTAGLRDNLDHLQTNWLAANVGEIPISWTFPDATVKSGNGYVPTIELADQWPEAERYVVTVVLTGGRLA